MSIRPVKRLVKSQPTMEGAGVRLRRAFGFGDTTEVDPFLLLDDFRGDRPDDYLAGFPWHPHRGIETITYVLAGNVDHGDSLGNKGTIGAGDVQWMTAGSGIVHQEMPHGNDRGQMHGFQLWANLPSSLKMTHPRYQDVSARDIPEITDDDGTKARVICGSFWGKRGPVDGVAAEPQYVDIWVPPGRAPQPARGEVAERVRLRLRRRREVRRRVGPAAGRDGRRRREEGVAADNRSLILFDSGDEITVQTGDEGIRFLLVSGEPIQEPVAWRGPIVMNTNEELRQAFEEYRNGTFLKHG